MAKKDKWRGTASGLVDVPIGRVWDLVSTSSRLREWMPMVETCTKLAGDEGVPGYVRLVSGLIFPREDGGRSWIKERLVMIDYASHSYAYQMKASNVGLGGSCNTLRLFDYGQDSTLVRWEFEIDSLGGANEEMIVDYLGFVYKSCINRIEGAIEHASSKDNEAL